MKKAFTLIELLIVIVVLAILAGLVFRLGGIGSASGARNKTVARLQRLENALSGYYAAFGSYPPVQLQGRSRNIFYEVNGYGIQQTSNDPASSSGLPPWNQIEAACRAQPVAMEFPYDAGYQDYVTAVAAQLKRLHDDGVDPYKNNDALGYGFDGLRTPSQLSGKYGETAWTEVQVFKFGLMSYLLPRYLVMMGHNANELYDNFAQWDDYNQLPARFEDGVSYGSWNEMNQVFTAQSNARWKIALLPSQAVTARWLPNFEGVLSCNKGGTYYGINIESYDTIDLSNGRLSVGNPYPKLYSSGDSQSGTGTSGTQQYALNEITMRDGWGRELYYYSLPPYQSYRVWSAGPNGKTFPPWISPEEDVYKTNKDTIQSWVADDIVQMKE